MTAQDLTAYYVDLHARRPPDRVVGHVAKEIKKLLDEGFEPALIRSALASLFARHLHPSSLPALLAIPSKPPRYNQVAEEEAAQTFLPPEENARRLKELRERMEKIGSGSRPAGGKG